MNTIILLFLLLLCSSCSSFCIFRSSSYFAPLLLCSFVFLPFLCFPLACFLCLFPFCSSFALPSSRGASASAAAPAPTTARAASSPSSESLFLVSLGSYWLLSLFICVFLCYSLFFLVSFFGFLGFYLLLFVFLGYFCICTVSAECLSCRRERKNR